MSEVKHTPGPWVTSGFYARRGQTIETSSNVEIVDSESGFVRAILPYDYAHTSNAQQWADAKRIGRALSSSPAQSPAGWRPIESAPKDRRQPILLIGRYPTGSGWTDVYHDWWADNERWARWPHAFAPTHWAPVIVPAENSASSPSEASGRVDVFATQLAEAQADPEWRAKWSSPAQVERDSSRDTLNLTLSHAEARLSEAREVIRDLWLVLKLASLKFDFALDDSVPLDRASAFLRSLNSEGEG